jgi:cyclohexyl-isocyanide hydratase
MRDPDVIGWLKRQAGQASTVTSLCSGSLILGAAGLLAGYRAAAHWA